ncbi:hypothetical protein F5887DRAFT_892062 [Amanita rubescens]|nr:hypothetical protein F5887DRAFT_892062 [Amanita rubescens]
MDKCELKAIIDAPALFASAQTKHTIAKKFVKHHVYWLSDGNTLVQIGDVRFRLHRSTLVKQSHWFRKMIKNPPHDAGCIYADEETGATVYCLDSLEIGVKDFATLLNALDDAVSYVFNGLPSLSFVSAILRAAHALDFDQFREFAISCLEHKYPNRLNKLTTKRVEYAASTVQLARQCNVNSVLKRALYELVRAEGFKQETEPNTDDYEEAVYNQSEALTIFDYSLLVHAREQLTTFWFGKIFPPPAINGCQNHTYSACAANWGKSPSIYKKLVLDSKIFERYRYDPICGLDAISNAPWCRGETWPSTYGQGLPIIENDHLCHACAQKWRSSWREEKSMLWNKLDTWFELSD